MTETTTLEATIDTYLEAYLEPDAERRARLIEQVWAPDGHLFDPPLDARATTAINEMFVDRAGACSPGTRSGARAASTPTTASPATAWELVAGDGAVALAGMDVAVVGQDGRLTRVAGFFGDLPARDA